MDGIKIDVTGNIARVIEKPLKVTAGTVGLPVEFTFDGEWEGLSKTAVFQAGFECKIVEKLDTETVVPWEVLNKPGTRLIIGVYGVNKDGSIAIPTTWANVCVIHDSSRPEGDPATDPSIPIYQKLMNDMEELSQGFEELTEDVEKGLVAVKPYIMVTNDNLTFYVDGDAGSDDSDGLTKATAFKTINRYIEELNRQAEVRCTFVGNCDHYLMDSAETFNAVAIHFIHEASVDNITIDFRGVYTPAGYNCHFNVICDEAKSGEVQKTFTLNIPNNLYFDGGAHVFRFVKFTNGQLAVHGGSAQFNDCEFDNANFRCTNANIGMRRCKIVKNGDLINLTT